MEKKIKLIWDFYGGHANGTAEHHSIHLNEYAERQKLTFRQNGVEKVSDNHSLAYLIVAEKEMIGVRDVLRPRRAEYVDIIWPIPKFAYS